MQELDNATVLIFTKIIIKERSMLEVKQIEQLIEKGSLFINFECDEKTAFELLESLRPMIKSQSSVLLLFI